MNSRTSRPRSPTSAMTLISAEELRAIMPSMTDLPTPEPANIAHPLSLADRRHQVDGLDPGAKRLGDPLALQVPDTARPVIDRASPCMQSDPLPSIGCPSPPSTRPIRCGCRPARAVAPRSR